MENTIPASVTENDEQHTMHYATSLPYAHLLDQEAEQWLNDICTNLVVCVKAKDFHRGALCWIRRLSSYLDMKHAISREKRASLAKLLYEMIIMPGMDPALIELWANNCIRLIRHKKRLNPKDLSLDWRPLYELIKKTLFPKARQRALISESKLMGSVLRLVAYAQRFFPPSSTTEVLDEFLPIFTTHSVSVAIRAQGYLVHFLPVENNSHPETYLPTIFSLWSIFTCSLTYDAQFIYLISRIAESNLNIGNSDIGIFTHQQIKYIFTVGLRMMSLPVGSRSDGTNVGGGGGGASTGFPGTRVDSKAGTSLMLSKKPEKFTNLARFIVYTIMPEENTDGSVSYTLDLLAELVQAAELYFHPSNTGLWSYNLTGFTKHLAIEFLKRWREEQEDDCTTPLHRRLTPQIRKAFVLILRPVTYLSMFGKDQYIVGSSQSTLKHLAWLEPDLIFPGLLERIYPSLETLTETHRTSSALSILTDIALPLFSRDHYPAGGKHLLPLLHLAIPGIDMNDPIKTIAALMFISTALMSIPIIDLSQQPSDGNSGHHSPTILEEENMLQDDPNIKVSRETEDYLVKMTTGQFEEWLAKFMRRVFTIFENLPQENRKKQGGAMEAGITQMLLHACDIVFSQLSEPLYDLALKLVVEFVGDRVLPNAVRSVGLLCDAITSADPAKAAKAFIPLCIVNIQVELKYGASSTVTHAAASNLIQSDSTFHWYQNILFSVVSNLGSHLLPYKNELFEITHDMMNQCRSRRGTMWTGKLIRSILVTLLDTYPNDFKSLNPSVWRNQEYMNQKAHLLWGQPGAPNNLEIKWHVPSDAEKDVALEFLAEFLTPSMERLIELTKNEHEQGQSSHDLTNEFCRHLSVVRNCLMGSSTMVEDDGDDNTHDVNMKERNDGGNPLLDQEDEHIHIPQLQVGYAFQDLSDPRTPRARAYRHQMGQLVHHLSTYFQSHREDDVESVKILIKIARAFLSERGVEKNQFDRSKGAYSYAKNIGRTPLCKKQYPRNLLVRRAYNHHLLRLRQNITGRTRTPLHDAILTDLLEMSLGSYAEIRKVSQVALSATARCFRDSKSLIVPVLLDALLPSTPADRMKGALYLFTHKSILMPCLRNWLFIPRFVMTLCGGQHQDKLTIQELIRKVFLDYISHFNSFSFKVIMQNDIDPFVLAVSESTVRAADYNTRVKELAESVEKRQQLKLEAYDGLMDSLMDFLTLKTDVHWRYATMAANFIEVFLRSDAKPSQKLAKFANDATLSELPTMRRIGVSATTQLLLYIKQRTLADGDDDLLITKQIRNPLKVQVTTTSGSNENMGQALLDASYQPLTADNCNTSLLVDNTTVGWYVWPEHYTAYKMNTHDFLFQTGIHADCQEAYQEFLTTFTTDSYWAKICSYISLEVNNKQEDRFGSNHARLFTSIFQTLGDAPLEAAKPHIEKLLFAHDQKNSQRAAAEMVGGLVRGAKHWNLTKLEQLWTWLIPALQKAFHAITSDSLTYWESFVRFCSAKRDPRRIQPLIDLILDEAQLDPTSDAAFSESCKLLLVRALVVTMQWRFVPLNSRVSPTYFENIQHPYKQVREVIGVNINDALQLEWIPSVSSVSVLLKQNALTDGVGNVPTTLDAEQKERTDALLANLDNWFKEMMESDNISNGSNDYAHASKTILCWLHEALNHWSLSGTLPYIIPFLPKLFTMQEINDDLDLQQMATRVLSLTARLSYPPSMISTMVDQFLNILTTSSNWHTRIRTLPVLQIFFFKHLFAMENSQVVRIMEVVGRMLMDQQIEVRQLASVTLGGLVRCSQRDAIQPLLDQFSAKIQIKIPKRTRDKVTGKNKEPAGFAEAVLEKHAGVLGLSCLVNAFPYEVPEWMPAILCQLADCISDPIAEIQATIRKTFSDFRRTHSDAWHEDMLKFSEDQLSILSDMLISPSYYA